MLTVKHIDEFGFERVFPATQVRTRGREYPAAQDVKAQIIDARRDGKTILPRVPQLEPSVGRTGARQGQPGQRSGRSRDVGEGDTPAARPVDAAVGASTS